MKNFKNTKGNTIKGRLFLIYLDAIKLAFILNR